MSHIREIEENYDIREIEEHYDIREIEEHFDYAIHTDTATTFKYIKHKTSEGNINLFRVTKIETGYLRMKGEDWTHYDRNIYVEDVGFGVGQFICKDENGSFQIWDNFESKYVDYLSYDKKSNKDTIEFNFWIRQDSNTNECYKAPNIKSFLEKLSSARNYDIIYLN